MKKIVVILLLLPLLAVAAPQQFRDWQRQCERAPSGEQSCHILQQVVNPENGALAMRVQVGFTPQRQALLLISLPLGVALRPGVIVSVDGQGSWPVSFEVCSADGCRAAALLSSELLRAMKKGSKAHFGIADLSGRKLVVPLSLLGFTRAYASIAKPTRP